MERPKQPADGPKPDIPKELLLAAREYARLRRAGRPVPDGVRVRRNEYARLLRRGGGGKSGRPVTRHDVPAELRDANRACMKMKREGKKPDEMPADLRLKYAEYYRWIRHGGKPPPRRPTVKRGNDDEWPRSAYLEHERLLREGVAPGDIPESVERGYAEYRGMRPKKYTPCSPSNREGGRGCRGRHGKGPKRLPYSTGAAMCTICSVAYLNVPPDTFWCGCCGSKLRLTRRHKDSPELQAEPRAVPLAAGPRDEPPGDPEAAGPRSAEPGAAPEPVNPNA